MHRWWWWWWWWWWWFFCGHYSDECKQKSLFKLIFIKGEKCALTLSVLWKDDVFSDFLQIYYHGETIKVHVSVKNDSNKNVKNIILSGEHDTSCRRRKTEENLNVCCVSNEMFLCVSSSVDQVSTVVLYSNDAYVKSVAIEEQGCVIFWFTESQNSLFVVAQFTGCRQFVFTIDRWFHILLSSEISVLLFLKSSYLEETSSVGPATLSEINYIKNTKTWKGECLNDRCRDTNLPQV